ncbi:YceI family protein [Chondrinema litorale]|uniref:YceI family protein n=1 Tax=Chondrinema litorale TaxID=2994555 RepID=UPI002542CBBC|nr:YceI family protein [Chondrinema litorale]UZR96033.1 YceI family protein [Chondrinema litorale]
MKFLYNYYLKISLLFFFNIATIGVFAQSGTFKLTSESEVSVDGSSTLHSWKTAVNTVEGELQAGNKFAKMKLKEGEEVGTVALKFEVASMDGGRGDAMNDKITNAFKASENPYIEFKSTEPAVISSITNKVDNIFLITSKGELSMAGKTQPVEIQLEGKFIDANTIQFTGKREMKMSDFGIEQPSAMFGTIVAGDDITVNFDLKFSNTTNKM